MKRYKKSLIAGDSTLGFSDKGDTTHCLLKAAALGAAPKSHPRYHRGLRGYHAGLAAEYLVADHYNRRGHSTARHRWRGQSGEIDLICHNGAGFIFVEVKKSRSFDDAMRNLSRRQIERLHLTTTEYLATQPKGCLTEARFDLATVNARGEVQILENAIYGW